MKKNSLSSKEYWEKREAYKLKKGLKDLNKIEKELADVYKEAMTNISKEISYLFDKYSKDNNLSYKEANRLLNSKEYREFKYDLKTYMKLIEQSGDKQLLLELNTLAMKSRISRLEEMLYQCDKYINEVYKSTNNKLEDLYTGTIKDNYYQTIFDIHKSIGAGVSFSYIDNDMIKDILAFPWSGRNYSQNLWINRTKLKENLKKEITQMIIKNVLFKIDIDKNATGAGYIAEMSEVAMEAELLLDKGTKLYIKDIDWNNDLGIYEVRCHYLGQ